MATAARARPYATAQIREAGRARQAPGEIREAISKPERARPGRSAQRSPSRNGHAPAKPAAHVKRREAGRARQAPSSASRRSRKRRSASGVDERERAVVGRPRLLDAVEPAQQLGARGVQVVVAVELEAVHERERALRVARLGHRGGPVELDHGRAGAAGQLAVQRGELRPVRRLLHVQRRDRRLQDVARPRPPSASARSSAARPAAILAASHSERSWSRSSTSAPLGEARRRAARRSRASARAAPCTSGSSGISSASARPSRMASAASASAAAVALVEDQVDDRQHRGEAVRAAGAPGGTRKGMPAARILCFARTSRLAIVASGTRNARAISSVPSPPSVRRVSATWASSASAGWQQVKSELEPLVGDRRLVGVVVVHGRRHLEQAGLRGERPVAADPVDRAVARGGHEPRARVGGRPLPRPARGGDGERLLGGLLGEIEVAEEADQRGEDAAPLVAEDLVEDRYHSWIGRTSTAPPRRAAGTRPASSIAASRSSASKMK